MNTKQDFYLAPPQWGFVPILSYCESTLANETPCEIPGSSQYLHRERSRKQGWKDLDHVKSGWIEKNQVDELIAFNAVVKTTNEKQCYSQLDGGKSEYL